MNNHLQIVEFLVKNGADVDIIASNGETSLHIASSSGLIEIFDFLIGQKARIDLKNARIIIVFIWFNTIS